jgi:hypothetical protein
MHWPTEYLFRISQSYHALACPCLRPLPRRGRVRLARPPRQPAHSAPRLRSPWRGADQHTLTLRVGLASANISGLEATLQRISNPASPEYGQWLTAGMYAVVCATCCCDAEACTDQVKAYVAPKASTLAAFQAFADTNGLSVSPATETSEWVELTTTVAQANVLFGASYQTYEHASTGAALTRTLSYSLPVARRPRRHGDADDRVRGALGLCAQV